MTDEYFYTAFGVQLARTGTTVNPFQYVGEAYDPNCGFYYNRARWYDPTNGRFTSVDPFKGDPQTPTSFHQYLYANASPLSYRDPSGQLTLPELSSALVTAGIIFRNYFNQITAGLARIGYALGSLGQQAVSAGQKAISAAQWAIRVPGIYQRCMNVVRTADFSAGKDKAAFYTEWEINLSKAKDAGFTVIEDTKGGIELIESGIKSLPKILRNRVWDAASEVYAKAAEGVVRCFVQGSEDLYSTFWTIEYPILRYSTKVSSILYPGGGPGIDVHF